MERLIDAYSLLMQFCVNKDGKRIPEVDCNNFPVTIPIKDVKDIICNQPTAYDVDKVVQELKTDYSVKLYGSNNSGNYLIPVDRAVEIIKQGGVGKEV